MIRKRRAARDGTQVHRRGDGAFPDGLRSGSGRSRLECYPAPDRTSIKNISQKKDKPAFLKRNVKKNTNKELDSQ